MTSEKCASCICDLDISRPGLRPHYPPEIGLFRVAVLVGGFLGSALRSRERIAMRERVTTRKPDASTQVLCTTPTPGAGDGGMPAQATSCSLSCSSPTSSTVHGGTRKTVTCTCEHRWTCGNAEQRTLNPWSLGTDSGSLSTFMHGQSILSDTSTGVIGAEDPQPGG